MVQVGDLGRNGAQLVLIEVQRRETCSSFTCQQWVAPRAQRREWGREAGAMVVTINGLTLCALPPPRGHHGKQLSNRDMTKH